MPSRNILREDAPATYYHIYARGASKREIFLDASDYEFFLLLFARHLSIEQQSSRLSVYPHLRGEVQLLAYCLMSNHFHILVYQVEQGSVTRLMRSIMTSYSPTSIRSIAAAGVFLRVATRHLVSLRIRTCCTFHGIFISIHAITSGIYTQATKSTRDMHCRPNGSKQTIYVPCTARLHSMSRSSLIMRMPRQR